jgi:hypothetical protein
MINSVFENADARQKGVVRLIETPRNGDAKQLPTNHFVSANSMHDQTPFNTCSCAYFWQLQQLELTHHELGV